MRVSAALAVLLALTGCDRSFYSDWSREKTAERADIADVNARNGLARIEELQGEVEDLRRQVETLQGQQEIAETNINTLFEKAGPNIDDWQTEAIETLYENDRKFAARTGLPFEDQSQR
jgi:hypothetical protein